MGRQAFGADAGEAYLNISDSTITGNFSTGGGGGLYLDGDSYSAISESTISNNSAHWSGGGIDSANWASELNLSDCTISGNISESGNGGGLYTYGGTTTISYSLFDANTVASRLRYGGGVANFNGGTLTITNSTIAQNRAYGGAGIDSDCGTATVEDSTIWDNTTSMEQFAGGIYDNSSNGSNCVLEGDIVGDNLLAGNNAECDLSGGAFTGQDNLIGDGSGGLSAAANLTGIPNMSPLGYYGGPTETYVPLPMTGGNPAMGNGYPDSAATFDQRGFPRSTSHPDIGAFQSQPEPIVVTTLEDAWPVDPGNMSLRDAINLANVLKGNQTIAFAPELTGTTTLTLGQFELDDPTGTITIDGPGINDLTVDANGARAFVVDAGTGVVLDDMKITGGAGDAWRRDREPWHAFDK